ncbi:MAG: prenyl protease-related protein [Gemmatimonadetes bacterium]|nr:prenyl protease-related protein [Gemmatimonadota bacterium]
MKGILARHDLPWIAPFAAFLLLLAVLPRLDLAPRWAEAARWLVVGGVLLAVSRPVLDRPDLLSDGYRTSALFSNGIVGRPESSFGEAGRSDPVALALRFARAALLVPVVEELFWRGWLPRWIVDPEDIRRVPMGTFTTVAFWISAVLFASEHGSWWEVGLAAGVLYNWWMRRTRSLGDCILAHAVTNACLSAWVVAGGRWEYW